MANSIGSEHQTPPRPPIRLLGSVLLLGTLLAWWGTRDYRHLFGELPRKPIVAAPPDVLHTIQSDSAMLARGFQVEQRECAGCHEMTVRSSGPSYREIVTFYLLQSGPSASKRDLLSSLAAAVAHPQPGWANFALGPPQSSLTLEDRVAVASWILNEFAQKTGASEGAER